MPADTRQHTLTLCAHNGFTAWYVHYRPQFCQQGVRLGQGFQPFTIAVKIVIHHGGVRFLTLGDVRQQPAATRQIHEGCIVRELSEYLDVLLSKHPLLSLERKR